MDILQTPYFFAFFSLMWVLCDIAIALKVLLYVNLGKQQKQVFLRNILTPRELEPRGYFMLISAELTAITVVCICIAKEVQIYEITDLK